MTRPPKLCPHCGGNLRVIKVEGDGRSAWWRVRVRLYANANLDDPVADSDPDREPSYAGDTVLHGLPAVAEELAALAHAYHQTACVGLDRDSLMLRLRGLRPTLSRKGGFGTWRVRYSTLEKLGDTQRQLEWLARVDVERTEAQT